MLSFHLPIFDLFDDVRSQNFLHMGLTEVIFALTVNVFVKCFVLWDFQCKKSFFFIFFCLFFLVLKFLEL
jgi:hypothetical protein